MTRRLVGTLVTTAPPSHDGRPLVRVGDGFVVGADDVGVVLGGRGFTVTGGVGVVGAGVVGIGEVADGWVEGGPAVGLLLVAQADAITATTASTMQRTRRVETPAAVTSSGCNVGATVARGDGHETRGVRPEPVVQTWAA